MWPFRRSRGSPRPAQVNPDDLGLTRRRGVVLVLLYTDWSPQMAEWARALDGGRLPDGSAIPSATVSLAADLAARYGLVGSPHILAVEAESGYVHAAYGGSWRPAAWDHLVELAASGASG